MLTLTYYEDSNVFKRKTNTEPCMSLRIADVMKMLKMSSNTAASNS